MKPTTWLGYLCSFFFRTNAQRAAEKEQRDAVRDLIAKKFGEESTLTKNFDAQFGESSWSNRLGFSFGEERLNQFLANRQQTRALEGAVIRLVEDINKNHYTTDTIIPVRDLHHHVALMTNSLQKGKINNAYDAAAKAIDSAQSVKMPLREPSSSQDEITETSSVASSEPEKTAEQEIVATVARHIDRYRQDLAQVSDLWALNHLSSSQAFKEMAAQIKKDVRMLQPLGRVGSHSDEKELTDERRKQIAIALDSVDKHVKEAKSALDTHSYQKAKKAFEDALTQLEKVLNYYHQLPSKASKVQQRPS